MTLKTIVPPVAEPVTLVKAKEHLRIEQEFIEEDSYISSLILAAREYCEGIQNRKYVTQELELILDAFPYDKKYIEFTDCSPVQAVTLITYKDRNGNETIWDPENYVLDPDSFVCKIILAADRWPSFSPYPVGAVRIRFIAGYPPKGEGSKLDYASNVPQKVKQAMYLLIGHWFTNRESVIIGSTSKEIEFTINALLSLDRVMLA